MSFDVILTLSHVYWHERYLRYWPERWYVFSVVPLQDFSFFETCWTNSCGYSDLYPIYPIPIYIPCASVSSFCLMLGSQPARQTIGVSKRAVRPRLLQPRASSAGIQHRRTPPKNASVLSRVFKQDTFFLIRIVFVSLTFLSDLVLSGHEINWEF